MVELLDVTMRFNLGIERNFTAKQWFVDSCKRKKRQSCDFYALKNISFKVERGEVVGFVGANGAGKSTLLKIISGVMKPTVGEVKVYGNICPMIELGAGFDMQLTARENVYLNGAIMGYSKATMTAKYNDIVQFSELEDFMDVPLQNYSSGMVARLAFSISTISEPEILIVDEILSVGDVAFQEKSMNKMLSMIGGGTTVLFVSHSTEQIKKLCSRVIWLHHGEIMDMGGREICDKYTSYMAQRNEGQG